MCSVKEPGPRQRVDAAAIGVFAWRAADGSPRGCAVTPYRIGEDAVVSSTLALLGKIHAVRRDPRVALLTGGLSFRGDASVELDRDGVVFDAHLRAQELRKFPPSRALLALPFHRRLLWWYVGRALVRIPLETARPCAGDDRATWISIAADGYPEIRPLSAVAFAPERLVPGERIELPAGTPDGPRLLHVQEERALLLVHEEHRGWPTFASSHSTVARAMRSGWSDGRAPWPRRRARSPSSSASCADSRPMRATTAPDSTHGRTPRPEAESRSRNVHH
jgi:hypothetical protein